MTFLAYLVSMLMFLKGNILMWKIPWSGDDIMKWANDLANDESTDQSRTREFATKLVKLESDFYKEHPDIECSTVRNMIAFTIGSIRVLFMVGFIAFANGIVAIIGG